MIFIRKDRNGKELDFFILNCGVSKFLVLLREILVRVKIFFEEESFFIFCYEKVCIGCTILLLLISYYKSLWFDIYLLVYLCFVYKKILVFS